MKKTYLIPKTTIVIVQIQHHLMDLSGAGQNGLSGITKEEYTGGDVKWSRGSSLWDDEDEE